MRSLFVASAGGHLEELRLLAARLAGGRREITWVTWPTAQSVALLRHERHEFIDFVRPHDLAATFRTLRHARRILAAEPYDEVVSTGSLPAVPFMALARAQGIACHYIESAARSTGPSLAGRLVAAIPGVHCYRQFPEWSPRARWSYCGSVFDAFAPGPDQPRPVRRAVVSVGSSRYGFRRLVEEALAALPEGCEVLWQTGSTDLSGLGVTSAGMVPPDELAEAVASADVVVAHGGVGTALLALEAGRCPVLVPREAGRGEHVDDHQRLVVEHLAGRGLCLEAPGGRLGPSLLESAAARTVVRADLERPLVLAPAHPRRARRGGRRG